MADLLSRHGHVLRDDPHRDDEDAGGPRGFPARWRRTLIAVGCVVAAGSVLGGAVAVGNAGHEAPLGPVPGGLLDQLTRGPAGPDQYAPYPGGSPLPDEAVGPRPAGVPLPRTAGVAPAAGVLPAPRAPGGAERLPPPTAAPVPGGPAGGTDVQRERAVEPAPAGTTDRAATADAPQRSADPAPEPVEPAPAAPAPEPAPAGSPAPAPAPADSGGGPAGGLLGGVTDTVGGLLGG